LLKVLNPAHIAEALLAFFSVHFSHHESLGIIRVEQMILEMAYSKHSVKLGLKEVRRSKKNDFRDGRNSQPAFKFNATLQLGNFIFLQINLTLQILNLPSTYNQKHWLVW
jgi:hypothetical protein